ncbi:MAG: hypothetical protein HeimC2_31100 [Candidatus Heimdallarchaeota archaeon LC_2]|nr:MAG: hypothetical protein HeimC2_31100 [Candidatus Heimdallarchaeota archaeon LC_2]
MVKNKQPYSGKEISYDLLIPEEWASYLSQITSKPIDLIYHLVAKELYRLGMINIEPKFNDYNELFKK